MSTRLRRSLPALLAITLAAVIIQAPASATPAARPPHPAHSALVASRGFGSLRWVNRGGLSAGSSGFGSALVGSALVGRGPSFLALDPATHTIYVANGYNDNGPDAGGDTVSVIDARRCDASDVSRCQGPWPTITVGTRTPGDLPAGIAVDVKTDTVYVANVGADTVSVFNGATCNAADTSGCGRTPAEVPVGLQPLTVLDDPANHTVYVTNYGAVALGGSPGNSTTVSMIDSATCNATDLASCPAKAPPTVNVGAAPDDITVNQATHTVYVTTIGAHKAQNGWAVFDASTCNATVQSGCATIGRLIGYPVGLGPNAAEVDPANDTLYSADYDNTIAAFSLAHCDAADLAGCASDTPGVVTPFPDPGFGETSLYVAVDAPLHSVYVSYQQDAVLVVVNTNVCNGRHLSACATLRPPTIHTGTTPEEVVLDAQTQTLYTANPVDNDVSVIAAVQCNAEHTAGCRHPVPSVRLSEPTAIAADDAVSTAYVGSGPGSVAMIDTRRCRAGHSASCSQPLPRFSVGGYPAGIAVDPGTHTVYIATDTGSTGTVSVIDDRSCNARHHSGCAAPPMLQVAGGDPDGIVVNPVTGTVYVTTITTGGPDLISVFNGATCNAGDTAGCGQRPALLKAGHSNKGDSDLSIAVDDTTNTLYVTNIEYASPNGHTVYVYNGATCDAADTTGCGQEPATVTVGDNPTGLVVDPNASTLYVINHALGDYAASVSVINTTTCNGHQHSGCNQTPPTVPVGFGAFNIAFDPSTHAVYTTNLQDSSMSVINTTTCNAHDHSGCNQTPGADAVGNYPYALAVDAPTGTIYVTDGEPGDVSLVPARQCITAR
jgi:DNA-binding beta-propeller fold protein YncE